MKETIAESSGSNREHVIAVAAQLFLLRGVTNTSMEDVVRESGVSKSNIYYHFKSKSDLLVAVAEYQIQAFEAMVLQVMQEPASGSVLDLLARYIARLTDELAGRSCVGGCPFASLVMETAGREERVQERINRFFHDQTQALESLLVAGMHRGEIRRDIAPAQAAGLIMSAVEGSLVLAQASGNAALLKERGLLLLDLLRLRP
ncbi:MAG TPA: TetR/AcrR family transcriptional regulator [Symbiobacteriaceae bacterium]|jgi:AcrR family transcriptional regulator